MKRTDLIALAERLSDARVYGKDIALAADFLRQIAQAQPVAWQDWDGDTGYLFPDGHPEPWRVEASKHEYLYTLPLED